MKFHCGHEGCDICGGRTCSQISLKRVGEFKVCEFCIGRSVKFAYEAACRFGGAIDSDNPCGMGIEKRAPESIRPTDIKEPVFEKLATDSEGRCEPGD